MKLPTAARVPSDPPSLEKIRDAARRTAVSVATMYRLIEKGEIGPLLKIGERNSAVPAQSVTDFIQRRIAEGERKAA